MWLRTFSPSLFKEQQQAPRSLGSTEGVEPGGRGAYVTHNRPAGGKKKTAQGDDRKTERKRKRSLHLKGAFSFFFFFFFQRQGPSLCEKRQGEKKHNGRRGRKKKKPAMSFIRLGGRDTALKKKKKKKLQADFQKDLSTKLKIKVLATDCEARGLGAEVSLWFTFWIAFCRQMYLCLFVYDCTQSWRKLGLRKKKYIYMSFLGKGWELGEDWRWLLEEGRASRRRRRSHQFHYKHLPAWPTSNAVSFHQPQPTQGHRVNSRNRWRLGGEKQEKRGGEGDFKNRKGG